MAENQTQSRLPTTKDEYIPFWRDGRVIGVLAQIVFLIVVAIATIALINNVREGLWRLGQSQFLCSDQTTSERCFFDFLQLDAQFDISETPVDYSPADSYSRAIGVGLLNTLKVSVSGIILATLLGTLVGIARLSPNWLVSNIAKWYIDLMRNTPLVLILLFLYLVVLLQILPPIREAIQPLGLPVFLSQRGINYPSLVAMPSFPTWLIFIFVAIIFAMVLWIILGKQEEITGKESNRMTWSIVIAVLIIGIGWVVSSTNAKNHSVLVPRALRVREIGDFEDVTLSRLGLNNLGEIEEKLASGELTQEELDTATISICSLRDTASEVNLTAQLRSLGVPYRVNRADRADQAIADYAEGQCEVFVATTGVVAAERIILEDANNQLVVPLPETPLRFSIPRIEGLNFAGGSKLTPEFSAVLIGLTIYTGAFIAEIVRAGILAVSKGQTEAARALGLNESQRLRLIVLPQALRVIIPPATSQYLNLTKNSSLAQFVAFPEIWTVSYTTINQSGRAVQIVAIVMLTYLTISLSISAVLNWYNQRISLVER